MIDIATILKFAKATAVTAPSRVTTPTAAQMEKIAPLLRAEFRPDELYVFPTDLANNQVDRSYEWFPPDILRQFAKTIIGRSHMVGHNYDSAPIASFFDAKVVKEADVNWLRCWSYMPVADDNELIRKNLDAGVYRYASIGFGPADGAGYDEWELVCDLCGKSWYYGSPLGTCEHWPGVEYEVGKQTQVATFHYSGKWQALEGSTVYLGCQYGAEHKANTAADELTRELSFERQTESLAVAGAVMFTKSLEGVAVPRIKREKYPPAPPIAAEDESPEPEASPDDGETLLAKLGEGVEAAMIALSDFQKSGRTLSAANEAKLTQARDLLDSVLSSVQQQAEEENQDAAESQGEKEIEPEASAQAAPALETVVTDLVEAKFTELIAQYRTSILATLRPAAD